jgi:hypothetical protein
VFAQRSPVGAPDPVPPTPAACRSTRIAGASSADQVGSPKSDEGTDGDGTSSNLDNQIIPPHHTKNSPIKSVPWDPSKTRLPVVPMEITFMDNGGNIFILDEFLEQMNSCIRIHTCEFITR